MMFLKIDVYQFFALLSSAETDARQVVIDLHSSNPPNGISEFGGVRD